MADAGRTDRMEVGPDLRLNVRVDGPEGAPALLFSNSLGSDLSMWDGVVGALGGRFRTVRYDTRGHGRSDAPPGPYSLDALGRDALAVLDGLGIERAHVCGLSLGGATGMWLGAHAAGRVDRLVLANTSAVFQPASMWLERAATVRANGLSGLVPSSMERWFSPGFRAARDPAVARGEAMVAGSSPEGYAGCCEALAATDLRDDLPKIIAPTLVIVGAEDPSTPPALGEAIRAGIAGATFVTLPAAHLSAMEVPDAFAAALERHLLGRS